MSNKFGETLFEEYKGCRLKFIGESVASEYVAGLWEKEVGTKLPVYKPINEGLAYAMLKHVSRNLLSVKAGKNFLEQFVSISLLKEAVTGDRLNSEMALKALKPKLFFLPKQAANLILQLAAKEVLNQSSYYGLVEARNILEKVAHLCLWDNRDLTEVAEYFPAFYKLCENSLPLDNRYTCLNAT